MTDSKRSVMTMRSPSNSWHAPRTGSRTPYRAQCLFDGLIVRLDCEGVGFSLRDSFGAAVVEVDNTSCRSAS
ncbi:hypothetical protein C487_14699 [Natrinema pallidum DSM 3751]|uniref:Uncharacterized protein n=1 Tax=Natrinema pallidum DSM 3751 TaxID=1227495 RepID=L9YJT7_9EURY|nr:hypothetical protein C487_14699 [Natrinema pallidum DSM 3751]